MFCLEVLHIKHWHRINFYDMGHTYLCICKLVWTTATHFFTNSKENEKEFIFKMKSGFDYDKVHQLNCSKPGLYLTTYRNLKFTLKEPKNFNVQMASSLGLLLFTRLTLVPVVPVDTIRNYG